MICSPQTNLGNCSVVSWVINGLLCSQNAESVSCWNFGSSGICLDDHLLTIDAVISLGQGGLRGKLHFEPPVSCFGSLKCPSSASAAAIVKDHEPVSNWCEYAALPRSSPWPVQLCRHGIQANSSRTIIKEFCRKVQYFPLLSGALRKNSTGHTIRRPIQKSQYHSILHPG